MEAVYRQRVDADAVEPFGVATGGVQPSMMPLIRFTH